MFGAVMMMKEKKENHGRSPTQLRKHEKKSTGLSFGNVQPRYNLNLPARPDALTYSGGVARSMDIGQGHPANESSAGKRVAIIQRMRNNVVQRCNLSGHNPDPCGTETNNLDDGLGTYRDQKGHHVMAKKAFEDVPEYDPDTAITISQRKLDEFEVSHASITGQQRSLYTAYAKTGESFTLTAMKSIERHAMENAGVPKDYAENAVNRAEEDLLKSKVKQPARIPWN